MDFKDFLSRAGASAERLTAVEQISPVDAKLKQLREAEAMAAQVTKEPTSETPAPFIPALPMVNNPVMNDVMTEIEQVFALTKQEAVILKQELLKLALQDENPMAKLKAIERMQAMSTLDKRDRQRSARGDAVATNIFNVVQVAQQAKGLSDRHEQTSTDV